MRGLFEGLELFIALDGGRSEIQYHYQFSSKYHCECESNNIWREGKMVIGFLGGPGK